MVRPDPFRLKAESRRRLLHGTPVLDCEFQGFCTAPLVAQRHSAPYPTAQGCLRNYGLFTVGLTRALLVVIRDAPDPLDLPLL